MSMDFMDAPYFDNQGIPMSPYGTIAPNYTTGGIPEQYQQVQQQPINMRQFDTPNIVADNSNEFGFGNFFDKKAKPVNIHKDNLDSTEIETVKKKKKKSSTNSDDNVKTIQLPAESPADNGPVIEEVPTGYTYIETTNMLRETLSQIDSLNAELMQEFTNVRANRTMRNKYNVLVGLSENVGELLNNKISAIREINNSISKANDLDYKKDKDRRALTADMDDDKYIADLYKSFMQNPANMPVQVQQAPQYNPSVYGSGIVRADLDPNSNTTIRDNSYLNYVSNLTPEQNLMRYEGNNNVKQVVVYDASNGNKFFQMMDMSTGQVIPNVPVYDEMFMEDTTLDLQSKTAKNVNLGETFPLVVINENQTSQY